MTKEPTDNGSHAISRSHHTKHLAEPSLRTTPVQPPRIPLSNHPALEYGPQQRQRRAREHPAEEQNRETVATEHDRQAGARVDEALREARPPPPVPVREEPHAECRDRGRRVRGGVEPHDDGLREAPVVAEERVQVRPGEPLGGHYEEVDAQEAAAEPFQFVAVGGVWVRIVGGVGRWQGVIVGRLLLSVDLLPSGLDPRQGSNYDISACEDDYGGEDDQESRPVDVELHRGWSWFY